METVIQIIFAFIALGILVFIHEFGHYWVALKVKMNVEVFSIGFGRPIYSWTRKGVKWQIGWLPFGGYVKIAGADLGKNANNDVPGSYFGAKPFDRLKVAIAGPLANLILAFLIFVVIWMSGGREKLFSEFTQYIGWVDQSSQVYEDGLRPGDILKSYNNTPYEGIKDLVFAGLFSDQPLTLKGFNVSKENLKMTPFQYTISPYPLKNGADGLRTYGILSPASFLIYERFPNNEENPLPSGSPMQNSGIEYGDRIVWVDGSLVFSQEEISFLINEPKILLSVERAGKRFFAKIPRIPISDLRLNSDMKEELSDWRYLAKLKDKFSSLYFVPYSLTIDCVVEDRLNFIDPETSSHLSKIKALSSVDTSLEKGDKIIAVGKTPVTSAADLLSALQTKEALVIVQKNFKSEKNPSWKIADKFFNQVPLVHDVNEMADLVANGSPITTYKELALLNPVTPKTEQNFALTDEQKAQYAAQILQARKAINEINDPQKRINDLQRLENGLKTLRLGIGLQDVKVNYNPNPFILFENVFTETWHTLVALVSGYINPKMLSGPVGIVRVIQHGWSVSINEALFWIAAISINLGFLNLLPIPVLDGGYILISLFEMITGRKVKPKTLERIIIPFVVLLIGFLIFVTYFDLMRL